VRFGVGVNDASLIPALLARLPPGARSCDQPSAQAFHCSLLRTNAAPDAGDADLWQVRVGAQPEARTKCETEALEAFEGFLRFEVARRASLWTFVHAGVVGWRGRAILIPGSSFSGKSTLVHALVRAGATYYSDEFAVFDRRGLVYPFAQPITMRQESGGIRRLTADDLGITPGVRALRVGTVVSTTYVPGAAWRPLRLSPAEGVLALLTHTVRAQEAPARVMRLLARVSQAAVTLDGPRGEAEETAADLLTRTDIGIPIEDIA
jgi:hypothetical protein